MRKQKLLLLQDIEDVGRIGDVVSVRAGYSRNFLIPKKLAIVASQATVMLQEQLKAERAKKAIVEKEAAETLAKALIELTLQTMVKVDPEGNLYGSVTAFDISNLLKAKGYKVEKRHVVLIHPIKTLGSHRIALRLEEGVAAEVTLEVLSEK